MAVDQHVFKLLSSCNYPTQRTLLVNPIDLLLKNTASTTKIFEMEIDTHINAHSRSCEESILGENKHLDSDTARSLFEVGANLFMLDVPMNTEIGVDMNSWNTGPNFKGIKMIPPGVHFVYWSAVSKEGQTAPRTGFFHDFRPKEVIAKRYNQVKETFEDILDEEEVRRLEINLKDFDRNLGAYPYDSWKKWVSLTNKISTATIKRLEPTTGLIQSVTELLPEEHKTCSSKLQNAEGNGSNISSMEPRSYLLKHANPDIAPSATMNGHTKRNLSEDDREEENII